MVAGGMAGRAMVAGGMAVGTVVAGSVVAGSVVARVPSGVTAGWLGAAQLTRILSTPNAAAREKAVRARITQTLHHSRGSTAWYAPEVKQPLLVSKKASGYRLRTIIRSPSRVARMGW